MEVQAGFEKTNKKDIKYLVGELYDIFSNGTRENKKILNPQTEEDEKINKKERYRESQLCYNLSSLENLFKYLESYPTWFEKGLKGVNDVEYMMVSSNAKLLTILYLFVNIDEKWINKRIDAGDMKILDDSLYNCIKITKPIRIKSNGRQETDIKELISNRIGWKNFLKAIRDAIAHRGFLQNGNGIYINYSNCIPTEKTKGKEDLECFITEDFIVKLLGILGISRRTDYISIENVSELNFSNTYNNYQSERNKIILNFYKRKKKSSGNIAESTFAEENLKDFRKIPITSDGIDNEKKIFPCDVFVLFDDFFKKYKWNQAYFDALLRYLDPDTNIIQVGCDFLEILLGLFTDKEPISEIFNKKMLEFRDKALKVYQKDYGEKSLQYTVLSTCTEGDDPSEWYILANTDILKRGLRRGLKKAKLTKKEETKVIKQILSLKKRFSIGKAEVEMEFQGFANYILYLYVAYWYLNNPKFMPVGKNTIIPEKEHIRNAIAHQNVFILPGVNKIVLWDPTQDKENSDWSQIYDLHELFVSAKYEFLLWVKDNFDLGENGEFKEYGDTVIRSLFNRLSIQ